MINFILSIKKEYFALLFVFLIASFLRFYAINSQMHFISDQGWFFVSAKNIFETGKLPLVGITSSHTWLHQGPIWTYMISVVLLLTKFNPVSVGYLSVILDLLTLILIYKVGSELFYKRVGLISSLLYATSPLIILHSRMPYHTSPIPLLSILFLLFLYRWVKGQKKYFPLLILICTLLYNFELATILFPFIVLLVLTFGIKKKKKWARIFNKKTISLSLFSLAPMIPILIYDFKNGFFQTVKFAGWLFFQGLGSFGIKIIPQDPHPSFNSFINFSLYEFRRTIFYRNEDISTIVLISIIVLNLLLFRKLFKSKKLKSNFLVFYFTSLVLFSGFISQRESSEAYLTMLFPYVIILATISVLALNKYKQKIGIFILILFSISNFYYLFKEYRTSEGGGLGKQIVASEFIVKDAKGKKISLQKKNFKSNIEIDQYRYLVWWKGGNLSQEPEIEYGIYNTSEGEPDEYIYSDGSIYITRTEKHFIVLIK